MIPTSKFDLKMQCLSIARGDVDKAVKLYDFVAGGLDIPDVTAPPPFPDSNVASGADSVGLRSAEPSRSRRRNRKKADG